LGNDQFENSRTRFGRGRFRPNADIYTRLRLICCIIPDGHHIRAAIRPLK